MAEIVYTIAKVNTSELKKTDADYFTAHDGATGTVNQSYTPYIGQKYASSNYTIYRLAFAFDTSSLPDDALIQSAYIDFCTEYVYPTSPMTVYIKNGAPTYPTIPNPVAEDYKISNYSGIGGEGIMPANDYTHFQINFNYTGLPWINKTGYSKFLLVSANDDTSTPPTSPTAENGQVYTEWSTEPARTARLYITYLNPTEAPAVSTLNNTCKDRQSTTLTATGDVTVSGGGYTYRGFEYYEYSATNKYDGEMYAVREIGVFASTGEFEITLYGLKPLTVYYIRAFVGNIFGIDYGDWVLCSTTEVPSYGIYSTTNTASYRLYVSDDEAIAWRGYKGPYTGKQTLINITDITNKTKGIKVLKILPDAKGTFHVCVTLKEEIKS